MKPEEIQFIRPAPPPPAEVFAIYQMTYQFHQELKHRTANQQYSEWYQKTAEQHQRELEQLQGDINILGWFNQGWRWLRQLSLKQNPVRVPSSERSNS